MLMISKNDIDKVMEGLQKGQVDSVDISENNLVDRILLTLHQKGATQGLTQAFPDTRERRAIPYELTLLLAIAAKMKVHTSLTDIPYAIQDEQTLAELGYCLWDSDRDMAKGLMDEGSIRKMMGKTTDVEWFEGYNRFVRDNLLPKLDMAADIHILDCTKIEVELSNMNYEGAGYTGEDGGHRGYKLATLRGLYGDSGMIEEVRFGPINTHDLTLSKEMILQSKHLKRGDILLMDRGFLSREVINELKNRGIEVYMPLRKDMEAYEMAVSAAKLEGIWSAHPNPKRKEQRIAFAGELGAHWQGDHPEENVPVNGCVVWDQKKDDYYVFVTTDTNATARQILKTYELRPEIEEEFRQMKDFWNMEGFKSRKLNLIAFHLVSTLLGYLFFQVFKLMDEGAAFMRKSLPVAMKKYKEMAGKCPKSVIVCVGQYFSVFPFLMFMKLYASLGAEVQSRLDGVLGLV